MTTSQTIPYTPDEWTDTQRDLHHALDLDTAFHHASCLAGGWYRRPISIDMRVTPENDEEYQMRPSDIAPDAGWTRVYTVEAHR
jgi:hypothetical protein